MPKLLCFFCGLLLLFTIGAASAAPIKPVVKKDTTAHIVTDSTTISPRVFSNSALQRYKQQKEFQYSDTAPKGLSWWTRFWRWFWQWGIWRFIVKMLNKIHVNGASLTIIKICIYIIAGGFIAFLIFKMLGVDLIKLFRGESQNVDIPYAESLENIHEISFDAEIENAIASRNYRIAVRLLYLRSLKQLSDAGLIHWQIEKTNASYLNELADTEYRQLFGLLTTRFEYIWYGDFPIDGTSFQNINALFIDFKKALP